MAAIGSAAAIESHRPVSQTTFNETEKNMHHRLLSIALALGATAGLGACVVAPARPAAVHVAYYNPPPPVVETVPPPPAVGYNWVPGHYAWRDGGWVWVHGHYVTVPVPPMPPAVREEITVAPSPAHVWVQGHWVWGGTRWNWNGGRWVLRAQIGG
jgi:hypothetical protein